MRKIVAAAFAVFMLCAPAARAQVGGYPPVIPMGVCQLTASASVVLLSTCIQASFTGTGAGTILTASAVTGFIRPGAALAGTGVPAGTTIVAQLTGPAGGAGTYQTSVATTSSGNALTTSGIPVDATGRSANMVVLTVETANIRWRDDGAAPTTAIGMLIVAASAPLTYVGAIANFQLVAVTGSPVVDAAYYRLP